MVTGDDAHYSHCGSFLLCHVSGRVCELVPFYAFLPYALYALLFALVPLRVTAKRTLQQTRLKAGDVLSVDLEIKRTNPFPYVYVLIEDDPPDTFHLKEQIEMKQMLFPWFRKTWRFSYQLNDVMRGEHHLSAVRIKTGDMFGFVEKEVIIPLEKKAACLSENARSSG